MKNYGRIISAIGGSAWAIMPEKMEILIGVIKTRIAAIKFGYPAPPAADSEIKAEETRIVKQGEASGNGIGVIPIYGTISQRLTMMDAMSGGTSTEDIAKMFDEAMADSTIGSIILDIDSPGGSVYGVAELADKIYQARDKKRVWAVANSLMASAAYWIGSAAEKVFITPSGEAGSVGVVAVHFDYSKAEEIEGIKATIIKAGEFKAEGNPHEPLSSEAKTYLQARVDDYHDMFIKALARNRKTAQVKVKEEFGQGRVFGATDAVSHGMADGIMTLDEVISKISEMEIKSKTKSKSKMKAEVDLLKMK